MLTAPNTIFGMHMLIAFAVLLQSIEMLQLQKSATEQGIWRWSQLKNDFRNFPKILRVMFEIILPEKPFTQLLRLQLMASLVLLCIPKDPLLTIICWPLLIGVTFLTSVRWRGAFNGGNDSMTLIVLVGVFIAEMFHEHPKVVAACLYYVALQVILSFVLSGTAKIRQPAWRAGQAVKDFLKLRQYGAPKAVSRAAHFPMLNFLAAWGLMMFELFFPLAVIHPSVGVLFIAAALCFHLVNFYLIGINRFFFTWLAAYPALLFMAF